MRSETPSSETKKSKKSGLTPSGSKCARAFTNLAHEVAGQDTGESKNANSLNQYSDKIEYDKYYTKESEAIDCLKSLDLDDYDHVIEPSAGNGNFFRNINHENKVGLDIKPECSSICEQDWFTYEIDRSYKNVLIVGNPPFGKKNYLSVKFIKHAASFCNVKTIAFVLPDVFNKHTLQKHIPKEFRLKYLKKLPANSFEANGEPFNLPCTFFVFDKSPGPDLRFSPDKYKDTKDFVFGTKTDFDFFILGASPNTVKASPTPTNRGYFIKVRKGVDVEQVKENFKKCSWTGNSSVSGGASWRTKAEIVCQYRNNFENVTSSK